ETSPYADSNRVGAVAARFSLARAGLQPRGRPQIARGAEGARRRGGRARREAALHPEVRLERPAPLRPAEATHRLDPLARQQLPGRRQARRILARRIREAPARAAHLLLPSDGGGGVRRALL